jgi:hypothetical protein
MKKLNFVLLLGIITLATSCDNSDGNASNSDIVLKQQSITPPFLNKLAGFENLDISTLLSSEDVLSGSPAYVFGGTADGQGLLKSQDGNGYTFIVNNEDNWSISRITLDKTFKPTKGEYILNSDGGLARLCSGTMVTPEEHGFGPLFLSAGESNIEAMSHAIDPYATPTPSTPKHVAAFGKWSAENEVPLPKTAYPNKTVIIIGEDATDISGGQIAMYMSNTVGDLSNGSLYILRRTDLNIRERDMTIGNTYDVEFVQIPNQTTLTGAQLQQKVIDNQGMRFSKVEDVDYRKGGGSNGREIYFNASGQAKTGVNADFSRTYKGRTYRLILDAANPLKGKLECILDGDDSKSVAYNTFQNPDNVCVTTNYVYLCEDANEYGDETHNGYIYQYDIANKTLKTVVQINKLAKYNTNGASLSTVGDWETSGLIDISDVIGVPNTFSVAVQSHTWTDAKFKNPDGGTKRSNENQGSQIVIIKGLPR